VKIKTGSGVICSFWQYKESEMSLSEVNGYWFFDSWSISEKFFEYPYPNLIRKFLEFSIRYPSVSKCDTGHIRNKHSGYKSTRGPPFLKTYSSIACNMTQIHDRCAVGWTTLGRNLVTPNLTLIKPKPHIWPQKFGNFWKK